MAVPKDKVKAALDIKFKGKSVSKDLKDSIAARWADKIEDEEGIDAYISDREDDVLDAAKEADRRATAATAKAKADAEKAVRGESTETEKPEDTGIHADTPEWAKALILQNKALADKVNAIEAGKQAQSIAERFNKDPRVKDVPEFIRAGYIPTSEADFEEKATALSTKFGEFSTQYKLQPLGNDAPPAQSGIGQSPKGAVKEASKEQLDAVMNNL